MLTIQHVSVGSEIDVMWEQFPRGAVGRRPDGWYVVRFDDGQGRCCSGPSKNVYDPVRWSWSNPWAVSLLVVATGLSSEEQIEVSQMYPTEVRAWCERREAARNARPATGHPAAFVKPTIDETRERVARSLNLPRPGPAPPTDEWVVVGRTTIDGTRKAIAQIVGCELHKSLTRHMTTPRFVGGRWLRGVNYCEADAATIRVFVCDVVRPAAEAEAEAERKAEADAAQGAKRPQCPECGPHGGKGMVELLESWVPCRTCDAAVAADYGFTLEEAVSDPWNPASVRC